MSPDRLTAARDIKATFAAGPAASCRAAVLFVRVRGDRDPTRLAVVAGRKVGGAVVRNRAKRRLRAAAAATDWPAGHDAVLTARHGAVTLPFAQLMTEVSGLVHKGTRLRRVGAA